MINESLTEVFERNLKKLAEEISAYRDENNIWAVREGISNSAGNLCLHLMGNLNYFIGAVLGNTGYVRHREDEFSLKNIPRQDLLLNIDNCIIIVRQTIHSLNADDLEKEFPVELMGQKFTTLHMLVHLAGHLTYHLGQINYHRRLLDAAS